MPTKHTTGTTPMPCPDWCQLWSGHGLPDEAGFGREHSMPVGHVQTATVSTPGVSRVSFTIDAFESVDDDGRVRVTRPYVTSLNLDGLAELTADDARRVAELLYSAADQLDKLTASLSRGHLALVTELGR